MDVPIDHADFRRAGEAAREPMPDECVWHAGWVVGMAAAAAGVLATAGLVPAQVLLALSFMALPGIIGAVWRPRAEERFALLALWSLGAALAVCVTGGLSGPLAVLCVTPALACLAVGGSWRAGAGLAVATVLFSAFVGVLHLPPTIPAEPGRGALTLIALLVTAAAAGGALLVARLRAEEDRDEVEAELAAFQSLMGDLPELALAMDGEGRTEAVFGQPLEGLDMDALHVGLTSAAVPADRARLDAAIDQAFDKGSAQASFSSICAPDRRITVALQRTGTGGLTAILRKAPEAVQISTLGAGVVTAAAVAAPPPADLTERLTAAEAGRRDAELGRDRAEAVATARARFLANMSHELRTPLNAIMGFSDMMRAKMFGELPPKYAEYAELIHESGGHLLDLINDVLDMSKIEAQRYTLSREVFDVRDALAAALRLMRLQADEAGVKLRAVLPPDPLMVDADKRAVKQIALNLLSNALKFTPKEGTVILTALGRRGDLEIVVADTGMGIAADDLKRLGQPFEQAGGSEDRARGAGLGLSLVDAFAKLHGGSLTLESRLGEGTAATVRMPVLVAPVPEPVEAAKGESVTPEPVSARAERSPAAPIEPEVAEPKVVAPEAETPPASRFAPPPVRPDIADTPHPVEPASFQTEPSSASLGDLGPLDARAAEHHGLRQTVINLFAHRPQASEPS